LVALALTGVVLFLRTRFAAESACTLARRQLSLLLNQDVGIGACELDPLEQRVKLHGFALFEPGSDDAWFAASEVEVGLRSLRPGGVELELARLVHPRIRVDASVPPAPGKKQCALEPLQRVGIRHLDIQSGELHLALPEGRTLDLTGVDVGWKTRRGVAELSASAARGRVGLGKFGQLPISRLTVEGGLDAEALRLELTRGEVAVDDATLSVVGRVDNLCDPTLALDGQVFLPIATLSKVVRLGDEVSGHLWTRVVANGRVATPKLAIDVVGTRIALGKFEPGDFKARLSLAGSELKVDELTTAAGAGTVRAEGSIKLAAGLPIKLKVDVKDAEFGRILERASIRGSWVDFSATGKATLAGHLLPTPHLTGDADMHTAHFRLTSHAFDAAPRPGGTILAFSRAHVQTGLRVQPDRFEFTEAKVETDGSRVAAEVSLFYDQTQGISVHGTTDALDLSDFGHIAGIPWVGRGSGSFSIEGPYAGVHIDSEVSLRDFAFWNFSLGVAQAKLQFADNALVFPSISGQKGRSVYLASGQLNFRPESQGGLHAAAQAFVFGGRTEDLVDMTAGINSNIAMFRGVVAGDADGVVLIDCPANALDGVVKLNLRNTTYYGRRVGDGDAVLKFVQGDAMVLEKASLTGPLGTVSADGTYTFDGPLDFRFRGEGLVLKEIVGPERAEKWGLQSTLTLIGKVEGDAETPIVSGYLTSPAVNFAGRELGDTQLEGRIVGKQLEVWGRPIQGARTNLKMSLREPYPYSGQISLALPEIRPFLPEGAVAQGVSGSVSGTVEGSGTLGGTPTSEAHATIDKLTLARGDFQGANEGPVELSYDNGQLSLNSFTFKAPNTEIVAAGSAGRAGMDLAVHGAFDMRLLESFVPVLERTGGKVELNATLGGTLSAPTIFGSAKVNGGRGSVKDQYATFRGVDGVADFSESRLILHDVHGTLNDGSITADGEMTIDHFLPSRISLNVALDEVSLRPVGDTPVTNRIPVLTRGKLLLHGRPSALVLSGDLDILRLHYDKPVEFDSFIKQAFSSSPGLSSEKTSEWLALDIVLHAGEGSDVRIDNNLVKAKILTDRLEVRGTNLHPALLGTVSVAEGGKVYFRQNQFTIDRAQFDFKDRNGLEPIIDVHGQVAVRDSLVKMHAYGRAGAPEVQLTSDPQDTQENILQLLATGSTTRDRSNTAGAGLGLAAEAAFTYAGLDRVVQRFLPNNTSLLRETKFNLTTTYNEGSGLVEPAAQLQSKVINDRLTLRATEPFSGKGTKAQAEYRFTNNVSLQLQWDNIENDYSFGNWGGVLMWRGEQK
jgi:translocation and assembly module TamB